MGTKQLNISRVARGKIDKDIDKEFDNVVKQVEDKFNGILNKLNVYSFANTEDLRKIDADTATMGEIVNLFATFIKDLKEILTT